MFVLVTGAGSQLGKCLKDLYDLAQKQNIGLQDDWYFVDHNTLDITNEKQIEQVFDKCMPDIVVNCAAYTNVEGAEDNFLECNKVNCVGVQNLLVACKKANSLLITISTDYVYKFPECLPMTEICGRNIISKYGLETYGLREENTLEPLSNYAMSKYLMETICKQCTGCIVIRTSWLYSQYGNNFMKTIVNKIKNNEDLKVIDDQIGRPTNANDLAEFIMFGIIANKNYDLKDPCEIYNFQNCGIAASWYDFADKILNIWNDEISPLNGNYSTTKIERILTSDTKYKAKRPYYSVMDLKKAEGLMSIPHWQYSLKRLMLATYLKDKNEM